MLLIRYIFNSIIIFINELVFIILFTLIAGVVAVFFIFLPFVLAFGLMMLAVSVSKHSELLWVFLMILAVISTFLGGNNFYNKYTESATDFVMNFLIYPFEKIHDAVNSIFSITTEMELSIETIKSKFLKKFKFPELIISFFTNLVYFIKGGSKMISKKVKNIKKSISKKTKNIVDEGKKID